MKTQHHMFAAKNIDSRLMLSLLALIVFMGVSSVKSQPDSYAYTKISALGETAPGGIDSLSVDGPNQ